MSTIAEILLAGPRGFCAGVKRAIDVVEVAIEVCQPPVYVRKEIVHNQHVVETLRQKGAIFVDATCPLVTKVHLEAIRYARERYSIVLIGHQAHDEGIGTLGEAPERIHVIASADSTRPKIFPGLLRTSVYHDASRPKYDHVTEIQRRPGIRAIERSTPPDNEPVPVRRGLQHLYQLGSSWLPSPRLTGGSMLELARDIC